MGALAAAIEADPPAFLTEAAGEWKEAYLHLEFRNRDGTGQSAADCGCED